MKRYKISRIRPEINFEEAGNMADFELLLKSHSATASVSVRYWRIARGTFILLAVASLVYFAIKNDSYELGQLMPLISSEQEMTDVSTSTEIASPESEEELVELEIVLAPEADADEQGEKVNEIEPQDEDHLEENISETESGFVEAAPVEGFPALYQYFDENLLYPSEILEEGVEGSVIVRFDIDTTGEPANITVEKSLHPKLDSTAIALINKMPLWHPATLYEKPILSTHRIPLFFKIDETAD